LDGSINAPVLRKEEFILDWVLERLRTDRKTPYPLNHTCINDRNSADVQIQLWTVLQDVWKHEGLKNTSRISLFRKHNFPAVLLDSFQDLLGTSTEDYAGVLVAMDLALGVIQQRQWEVKIRAHVEQGISIFGLCLALVNRLPEEQCQLGDSITLKISQIFRSTLHDDRPAKKVFIGKIHRDNK
jgi:hypothetical protein